MPVKKFILYADFEVTNVKKPDKYTTYSQWYKKDPKSFIEPKIYSWCVLYDIKYGKLIKGDNFIIDKNKGYIAHWGINGKTFIESITDIEVDVKIYFNNLKGYDGHFIIPLLDKMNFRQVYDVNIDRLDLPITLLNYILNRKNEIKKLILSNKDNFKKYQFWGKKWLDDKIKHQWNFLLCKEYKISVINNYEIYHIYIGSNNFKRSKKGNRYRAIRIYDLLLLFSVSIKNMGLTLSKYFVNKGLDKKLADELYLKKELYGGYTRDCLYKNNEEFLNDGNQLDYLIQDCFIMYKFYNMMSNYYNSNWSSTIGATTYKHWIKMLGEKFLNNMINKNLVKVKLLNSESGYKNYLYKGKIYNSYKIKNLLVNRILPVKWLDTDDEIFENYALNIYRWYTGGLTFVNERYRGLLLKDISIIDINSSYPYQMVKNVSIPIGEGVKGKKEGYNFHLYILIPKVRIKNLKGLPFLFDDNYQYREYLKVLLPGRRYHLNSIDYKRFKKYYKCNREDYELNIIWSFKTSKMKYLFEDYVNKWYKVKLQASIDGNQIIKYLSKIFLNSLYGKFGSNCKKKLRLWDSNNKIWITKCDIVKNRFYLPLAICITTLARMQLVDTVGFNYKDVVYGDTDSLFILKGFNLNNLQLDKKILGAWDIELLNGVGIVRRTKQYIIRKDQKVKIVFAGINFSEYNLMSIDNFSYELYKENFNKLNRLVFEDYIYGTTIKNQLSNEKIYGLGVIIYNTVISIRPVWDYPVLTEQKRYKREHYLIDNKLL